MFVLSVSDSELVYGNNNTPRTYKLHCNTVVRYEFKKRNLIFSDFVERPTNKVVSHSVAMSACEV